MSEKQIKDFLIRLERATGDNKTGLKRRHDAYTSMYLHYSAFPGNQFIYVGESTDASSKLVGTEHDTMRKQVLSLMFRERGRDNRCINVSDAIEFSDFATVLNRFERTLLETLHDGAIGPAYDHTGQEVPGGFAVWRRLAVETQETEVRELITSTR